MSLVSNQINYVEFAAADLTITKQFFEQVFGWSFTDFGPDYTAFDNSGLMGGFYRADMSAQTATGSALIVLYHEDLNACLLAIQSHGGNIVKDIFEFPGGRRFHFTEPSGNELAVWSDK
ncbi:VOC family protein [Thalassotalea agarivorans]|uniref:VOC domain-containing protein n=1 Tax=Thalassotalea agarivorans TaxID=349064 RepID=A0A1I0GAZ3_THASX|nr:VOC family protein [Thalassotalea agarivorans]SET68043.1 hypothetical protein SAMN05660429_02385 [Thalassotalea agarivorans]